MPRWPVDVPHVTPHGKYGQVRRNKDDGTCGTKPYPCIHPALDLAGPAGTDVYAPEDCTVDAVSTGTFPPFRGYGPGVILLRGKVTGVYHLLAHLDPSTIPSPMVPGTFWDWATTPMWRSSDQRRELAEGAIVGQMSAANHVHWETRSPGWNGARTSPALWVKRYVTPSLDVAAWSAAGGGDGLLWLVGGYFAGKALRWW